MLQELLNRNYYQTEEYRGLTYFRRSGYSGYQESPDVAHHVVKYLNRLGHFKSINEDIGAVATIAHVLKYEQLHSITTVIGANWPRFWLENGMEQITAFEFNPKQLEFYVDSLVERGRRDLIDAHYDGRVNLILDDVSKLEDTTLSTILHGKSFHLSNCLDYLPTETAHETLVKIGRQLDKGQHIITSNWAFSEDAHPILMDSAANTLRDIGHVVSLRSNQDFNLPPARWERGVMDSFHVLTVS